MTASTVLIRRVALFGAATLCAAVVGCDTSDDTTITPTPPAPSIPTQNPFPPPSPEPSASASKKPSASVDPDEADEADRNGDEDSGDRPPGTPPR